jgi:alpha-L-rhamnosidase
MLKVENLRCEYRQNPIGIDVLNPRLFWTLSSDRRNVLQTAYQIQVALDGHFEEPVWDTGKYSSDRSIQVEYGGVGLKPGCRYFYRVRAWDNLGNQSEWSEAAFFETGLLDKTEWTAQWITPGMETDPSEVKPCPLLRTTFEIDGPIKYARLYATSLGLYELHLNGSRVGDEYFTPGWTSYGKVLQYQTYDVTAQLCSGKNAIGALLGEGWYAGHLTWEGQRRNIYGDKLALLAQLHIVYEDGRSQMVASDVGWKSSVGPVLKSEIYHGELYDATLEKEGWDTPAYDDTGWNGVKVLESSKDILTAQINEPVRKIEEIKPREMFRTPLGELVIDFGQNMVGWVKFKTAGKAGSRVRLKHAEVLDANGNFYTDNLRGAKQTIEYILKGIGEEVFEPHFTFQGFRYVKVEEYPGEPKLEQFTGIVVHSGMEPTGSFECSDPRVNQLQRNILWGQKGNFVDVPTDCPQRDERLGWTGDAQVFIRTACYNMNTALFFKKWLQDLAADQLPNGGVPFVVPHVLAADSYSSSAWGDAAVICPWTVYLCFGDVKILENQYESMKAWVEYIRKQGENEYLWNTGFHFGDWLGLDSKEGSYFGATANDLISTAYYAYSTGILAKTARVLGKSGDAEEYEELYKNVAEMFRKEFVTPAGRLAVPTQTAHVLALMFDLVEEKDRKRTADTLIKYLEENKYHLTTGFVGTPYLCHALSNAGYTDAAYKLLMQEDYPSWLYQVKKGATTIWEHWDGIKPDGSFWSADMNSFNHYAYGAVGDWLYRVVAGLEIREDKPGYKHIVMRPQPGGGLHYAKAGLKSLYGMIRLEWSIEEGKMTVKAVVPCNTTAELTLPNAKWESIKEIIEDPSNSELEFTESDRGIKVGIGSGEYEFRFDLE